MKECEIILGEYFSVETIEYKGETLVYINYMKNDKMQSKMVLPGKKYIIEEIKQKGGMKK